MLSAAGPSARGGVGNGMAKEEGKREAKLRGICGDFVVCLLGSKAWEPLGEDQLMRASYLWGEAGAGEGAAPGVEGLPEREAGVLGCGGSYRPGKGVQARAGGLKGPWRVSSGNFPMLIPAPPCSSHQSLLRETSVFATSLRTSSLHSCSRPSHNTQNRPLGSFPSF